MNCRGATQFITRTVKILALIYGVVFCANISRWPRKINCYFKHMGLDSWVGSPHWKANWGNDITWYWQKLSSLKCDGRFCPKWMNIVSVRMNSSVDLHKELFCGFFTCSCTVMCKDVISYWYTSWVAFLVILYIFTNLCGNSVTRCSSANLWWPPDFDCVWLCWIHSQTRHEMGCGSLCTQPLPSVWLLFWC
jgi:hypothetical protein